MDQEQIKQVLLNLVINAIQAMPNGGEVVLRAAVDDHKVRLEVQDQGIGIAEENLERIFNPFFTLEKHGWNQTQAAKYLNISRKTLVYRMEKFGLQPAGEQQDSPRPS